jgi:tRNA G10  N-methylase Trm11
VGDVVLDAFLGSGPTLIECKLLGRHGIGVDVSREAIHLARDRLNFNYEPLQLSSSELFTNANQLCEEGNNFEWVKPIIKPYQGDA